MAKVQAKMQGKADGPEDGMREKMIAINLSLIHISEPTRPY